MPNHDAIDKTWAAYAAAWQKFEENPLDSDHARTTLKRWLAWLDAFLTTDQPRRVQTLVKNSMKRANALGLTQRDLTSAWNEVFADRKDMGVAA